MNVSDPGKNRPDLAVVNADLNAESATLLTLQTRLQLGTIGLSIAQQSDQAVFRLF